MNDSLKLRQAMEEIKKIIKFHDLAAFVVLHTPGHSEYLVKIDPTYSCARFKGKAIKISGLAEKIRSGVRSDHDQMLSDTSNMFHLMAEHTGVVALTFMEISNTIDKVYPTRHYPNDQSPDQTKNN